MTAPRRYTCEQLGVCQATPDCTCPRAPTLATAPVAAPLTPAQAVAVTRHRRQAAYRRFIAWLRTAARSGG